MNEWLKLNATSTIFQPDYVENVFKPGDSEGFRYDEQEYLKSNKN